MVDPRKQALDDYGSILNSLDHLARVELRDWWEAANRHERPSHEVVDYLSDPFSDIVTRYGADAADSAVNYLITTRALDDELKWLPTPDAAETANYEQSRRVLEVALKSGKDPVPKNGHSKLRNSLTRLVLLPARETVWAATLRDGTRYARIPSPGSCAFCLMLASRGAVYSRDTVGKGMNAYHDNCRCLAVEAPAATEEKRFEQLPPINKQLNELWNEHIPLTYDSKRNHHHQRQDWSRLITYKRRVATGSDAPVRWPPIPGITTPTLSKENKAFPGEPLPPASKIAGHVLFGWTDASLSPLTTPNAVHDARRAHMLSSRQGHRFGTQRVGATFFGSDWSDQEIVDAVAKTINDPQQYDPEQASSGPGRSVRREVDGVMIEAKWTVLPGRAGQASRVTFNYGTPVFGKGVGRVVSGGKVVLVPESSQGRKSFKEVEQQGE